MDFIAEKLGISKRTIYELFQSKDELLNECIIYAMEIERKETKEIIENSENMIEAFLKNIKLRIRKMNLVSPLFIIDAKKYHFEVFNNKMREQDEVTYKSFVNFIKEGKEKGYFNPEINEEIVSKLIVEQFKIIGDDKVFPPDKYSVAETFENVTMSFIRGISTNKGLEIINKFNI